MKKLSFPTWLKRIAQITLILAISCFSLSLGSEGSVSASTASSRDACAQMLADAEARFVKTLAPDGSIPASPETKAAAEEYIRVSKLCYDQINAANQASTQQGGTPTYIDDGGLVLNNPSSAEFVSTNAKWGSSTPSTSGGTVSYSFMGNGISFSAENYGPSVAIASLPGFQACFITKIQNAFAAWQAVSN